MKTKITVKNEYRDCYFPERLYCIIGEVIDKDDEHIYIKGDTGSVTRYCIDTIIIEEVE